jgi:serine/threonine-protein phosphatase 2A regulatory subunit A
MTERDSSSSFTGPEVIELFKSELSSEVAEARVGCIERLEILAYALGPDLALSKLVPVISDCIRGDVFANDDEILLAFAKHLPSIVSRLPSPNGVIAVVGLLESLANQDETVIREAAVQSLGGIATSVPGAGKDVCFAALMRLFRGEWFSSKMSACGLAHYVYPSVTPEHRSQIRTLFLQCAGDEMPMVKRAASLHLKDLILVVEKEYLIAELVPIYQVLAKDETQEIVRTNCVSSTVALCGIFDSKESNMYLLETVSGLANDKSWRVRLAVAKMYGVFSNALGGESVKSNLLTPLMHMIIRDQEPDVRKAGVNALEPVCHLLSQEEILHSIIPLLPLVSKDQVQAVRAALSEALPGLAATFSKHLVEDHLIPLLLDQVKDEHPTIRFNATSAIGTVCRVLKETDPGSRIIAQLISLLLTLALDTNWRTRVAVLEQVPVLSELYGKALFESKLENLFLSFFGDSVYAIRESLTRQIGVLANIIGEEWTVKHLLPKVLSLYSDNSSYSSRIAILQALARLAAVMKSSTQIQTLILPILERGFADPVPNVRFTACKVAADIKTHIGPMFDPKITPLVDDLDVDVRFFAQKVVSQ